ncbi:hypothetical protein EJ06DRAFT_553613 [Trichodelitschia bisporula]|uniref:Uncharacterized protein n=1 Tax=Trichodelitschia bisporula TaxID=703511 RepID=A0A6G1I911_9PEZI|nr:hypothetical protein EJ06DRAFT_553613 [Trichodelitschia bisporula]
MVGERAEEYIQRAQTVGYASFDELMESHGLDPDTLDDDDIDEAKLVLDKLERKRKAVWRDMSRIWKDEMEKLKGKYREELRETVRREMTKERVKKLKEKLREELRKEKSEKFGGLGDMPKESRETRREQWEEVARWRRGGLTGEWQEFWIEEVRQKVRAKLVKGQMIQAKMEKKWGGRWVLLVTDASSSGGKASSSGTANPAGMGRESQAKAAGFTGFQNLVESQGGKVYNAGDVAKGNEYLGRK